MLLPLPLPVPLPLPMPLPVPMPPESVSSGPTVTSSVSTIVKVSVLNRTTLALAVHGFTGTGGRGGGDSQCVGVEGVSEGESPGAASVIYSIAPSHRADLKTDRRRAIRL